MKDLNQKSYNSVLLETSDFFKSQGINIIGEGYKEIATNQQLFESYVDALLEGVSADSQEVIGQLMANTNAGILRESSMSGIAPIASLSMPVIRKLWPKFALKDALKTEVAKTPRFVVSYMKPYIFRGTEEKVYLPLGLNDGVGKLADRARKDFVTATLTGLTLGTALNVDFGSASGTGYTVENSKLVTLVDGTTPLTTSATKRQPLDSEISVTDVWVTLGAKQLDEEGAFTGATTTPKNFALKVPTNRIDVTGSIFLTLKETLKSMTKSVDTGNWYLFADASIDGQLIVRVDLQAGKALVAGLGSAYSAVKVKAGVSTEFNETAYSVGFDVGRMDIDIPTGQHINAPLPIEALNDMMALYQIDGTKETVDLMTNVFAQRLDVEVFEFIAKSFLNQPGVSEFQTAQYGDAGANSLVFDVRPAAGFAGSPKAWREELKPQIDFLSQKIKNATYLQAGIFTIVGNPLDVQLLSNIDWQFRGGQGATMDGVDVDYSIGSYIGANAYRVIASVNVPAGELYLVFTPSSDTQMTYKYFPYTFSTEMGYIDPNRSRVPSIMMTKRHTFAEFLPAVGFVRIVNNNGVNQFNTGYWPTQANTAWGVEG